MDWDALGAIGELVGAVAVLITVGYLAVQIRQNTRALESAALNSLRDVHVLTEHNEHYNSLILKSLRNDALTDEERLQMVERFYTIMKGFEVSGFSSGLVRFPTSSSTSISISSDGP